MDVSKARTVHGATTLCSTAAKGHVDVVARLIAAGLNVNKVCADGATPLPAALAFGHADVAQKLRAGRGWSHRAPRVDGWPARTIMTAFYLRFVGALLLRQQRAAWFIEYARERLRRGWRVIIFPTPNAKLGRFTSARLSIARENTCSIFHSCPTKNNTALLRLPPAQRLSVGASRKCLEHYRVAFN